jgi:hypothetical protein
MRDDRTAVATPHPLELGLARPRVVVLVELEPREHALAYVAAARDRRRRQLAEQLEGELERDELRFRRRASR